MLNNQHDPIHIINIRETIQVLYKEMYVEGFS